MALLAKLSIGVLLLFSSFHVKATKVDTTSVHFFKGTFGEVLAEAKRLRKPIFIDVSTAWCKPCKLMKKEAFTNGRVASFFNKNYISFEVDAERGEGKYISGKFNVTSYPTLLFILPDSTLIGRSEGYDGISGLLSTAGSAINVLNDSSSILFYKKKYSDGDRSNQFLVDYIKKRTALGLPSGYLLDSYLKKVPHAILESTDLRRFVLDNLLTTESEAFEDLLIYIDKLDAKDSLQKEGISSILYNAWTLDFQRFVTNKNDDMLVNILEKYRKILRRISGYDTTKIDKSIEFRRSEYYKYTNNLVKYRPYAYQDANAMMIPSIDSLKKLDLISYNAFMKDISKLPDSLRLMILKKIGKREERRQTNNFAKGLNEITLFFIENKGNRQDLIYSQRWIARAVYLDPGFDMMNTYARVLYKNGRKKEAITMQRKAITVAEKEGVESKLLKKELNEMMSRK